MMADYCNQSAVWKKAVGPNEYAETIYADPVGIPCRKEIKLRLVRDKNGNQVVSDTRLFTPEQIQVDDLIDDRVVISAQPSIDLDGNTDGYEVSL
jgi:hypothetical protein